jgi:hypothetical protein
MKLDDLLEMLEQNDGDTLDTSPDEPEVSLEPAPLGTCTSVTSDTPQNSNAETRLQNHYASEEMRSGWWRFTYPNRGPKEAFYSPEVTRAEALASERKATGAEPFELVPRRPVATLSRREKDLIEHWLEQIDETDEEIISRVLEQCLTDQDARVGFLKRANQYYENLRWAKSSHVCRTVEKFL